MEYFKRFLPEPLRRLARNLKLLASLDLYRLDWRIIAMEKSIRGISGIAQAGIAPGLVVERRPRAEINRHEFRAYSQNGEDGILLWLFSKIGTKSKTFVEFGMGTGRESIATNLVLNFGWTGLLMDGSAENVRDSKLFFKLLMPWEAFAKLDIRKAMVTRENIEQLIAGYEPDLLAIDIDGNDYWVWEAITSIKPRVVVIEYNSVFGAERKATVPYRSSFDAYAEDGYGLYHGASLAALAKLGKKRGYALLGCDSSGINAFFVREDLLGDLQSTEPPQAFYENQHQLKRGTGAEQFAMIKDKPYVEV